MTSQSFHLIMLTLIGAMSVVSWHGYRFEPWDRKTALKWNVAAATWFGYLLWKGVPEIIEPSFIRSGLAVFAFVLALNARRLLLGFELLVIKHWAGPAIFSALRSNEPISADVPIRLGDRWATSLFPGCAPSSIGGRRRWPARYEKRSTRTRCWPRRSCGERKRARKPRR